MGTSKETIVNIFTGCFLEEWDVNSPWTTGIGGSETSQIEMTERLRKRGYNVFCYGPWPKASRNKLNPRITKYVKSHFLLGPVRSGRSIININYRTPELLDIPKRPDEKRWFVSQDVDYPGLFNAARLATVDRYITLCKEHARHVTVHYPILKDKIYISSNGVRSDYIENIISDKNFVPQETFSPALFKTFNHDDRVPYRMLFPSSPDRGLKFLLQNWYRIRERFPEATLHVAYGLNNMNTIIKEAKDAGRAQFKAELEVLLKQDGVTYLGRINQSKLYKEWFETAVFPYSSDFPETNCITIQDSMACGAIPVTTNHWAQGEWARACGTAYVVDGLPQKSEIVRGQYLNCLYKALAVPVEHPDRDAMMTWARETFDWENTVNQWEGWIKEDSK